MLRRKKKVSASSPKEVEFYGKGTSLVRADRRPTARWPGMGPNVPPDTFYVVGPIGALLQMVTITPRGLWCGWDTCSGCFRTVGHCTCREGVKVHNGVRHTYQLDGGELPDLKSAERVPLPPRLALREPIVPITRKKARIPTQRTASPGEKMTVTLRRKGR